MERGGKLWKIGVVTQPRQLREAPVCHSDREPLRDLSDSRYMKRVEESSKEVGGWVRSRLRKRSSDRFQDSSPSAGAWSRDVWRGARRGIRNDTASARKSTPLGRKPRERRGTAQVCSFRTERALARPFRFTLCEASGGIFEGSGRGGAPIPEEEAVRRSFLRFLTLCWSMELGRVARSPQRGSGMTRVRRPKLTPSGPTPRANDLHAALR